ncbi:hypothetical protein SANA_26930 [Gottschalkiaceae bacterium SANA]|nr:hypothetical protein SANA_26930 [Gottschalkiaceae bacterium SANA]
MTLSLVRQESKYLAIYELNKERNYPIMIMCEILGVYRSSYYKWLKRDKSENEKQNEEILGKIIEFYEEKNGAAGYRQVTMHLRNDENLHVNYKRVYRLMKIAGLKSICRRKKRRYTPSTPEITAENLLNRDFNAENIHQKWLTDVTEFKYGNGKKAYLSAILDLGDRSIVSYVIGKSNNNPLVFETFDRAVEAYPDATPLFHSDRGFQYTNKVFKTKLNDADMTQSMSRVGRCIDNGPMEGFWAILKTETYHWRRFQSYEELEQAIDEYISYYNHYRYQKRLNEMTPFQYRHYLNELAA